MEEAEVVRSFMEGRDVQQKLAAKRKRVRSGDPDGDLQDVLDSEHVTKKMSVSDMDLTDRKRDRVALLDAGSQYGKVNYAEGVSLCQCPTMCRS